jgi:hypothetical protein
MAFNTHLIANFDCKFNPNFRCFVRGVICIEDIVKNVQNGDKCCLMFVAYNRHVNPLKTKLRLLYLKNQVVPRGKRFSSRL